MNNRGLKLFFVGVLLVGCSGSGDDMVSNPSGNSTMPNPDNGNNTQWLIPIEEVVDGGPGKDGIPSIDEPNFVHVQSAQFLENEDLVVGVLTRDGYRAYPHKILDWHEIVNDEINGKVETINYCPLTGTAFGWNGVFENETTTFGVSGLLYNANLILYDRATDSYWSQLKLQCVNGERIHETPGLLNIIELPWSVWKSLYPISDVLSTETGFSRNYNDYPYGPYKTDHDFFVFPVNQLNETLPSKERVFAVIENDLVKVYRLSQFSGGKTIKDSFNDKDLLLVGNDSFIVGFELNEATKNLSFSYELQGNVTGEGSLFKDDEGNKWSAFGKAIEGGKLGSSLGRPKSVTGYWFAIAAFYPNPVIYE